MEYTNEEIDDAVKALVEMTEGKVPEATLRDDLMVYLDKYLLDLESSKRATFKDHGGNDEKFIPAETDPIKIKDLEVGMHCAVVAQIISEPELRMVKDKKIIEFEISDGTKNMSVTIWEPDLKVAPYFSGWFVFHGSNIRYDRYRGCKTISISGGSRITEYDPPSEGGA